MHFVFLIHGTWGQDNEGWYQIAASRENFAARLAARLVGTPLEGALSRAATVFEWSGANTHEARLKAAQDLALLLTGIRKAHPNERLRFHFVAHSHGGNVLLASLVWYLTLLPPLAFNLLAFPKSVTDDKTTAQFFDAVGRLYRLKQFHPDNDEVMQHPELRRRLLTWYQEASAAHARFRSGRMMFREQWKLNSLMVRLAQLLLEFSTYPAEHGIASLVFLGTPFYYKQWQSNWRLRALERLWNALGEALLAGIAACTAVVIGGALLSLLPWVPWIGLSPLGWPIWIRAGLGLAMTWGAYTGSRRPLGEADTNVYFDPRVFLHDDGTPPADTKGRTVFDALVISAGYVDEAFSGLSSFPLFGALAPRLVDGVLTPRAWTFAPVHRGIGALRSTIGGYVRRFAHANARRFIAAFKFLAYPLRLTIYTLVTRRLVMSQAARFALPLSHGLPGDEFLTGRIVVRQELDVPAISARHLDVARDLLSAPVNAEIDKQRFEFLWDDRVLAERFVRSQAAAQFHSEPSADVKRHALAIEERLREFFGVAGLRHSLYYENDAVLEAVAAYLLRSEVGAASAVTPSDHLPT